MEDQRKRFKKIFEELNEKIDEINAERRSDGGHRLPKAEVKILGQMSLLLHEDVAVELSLAQTADLDALLDMQYIVKEELKKILSREGLVYDEDSPKVWIPTGAKYEELFSLSNVRVTMIDPVSALVSKAVKAPQKNKQLIREAIASEKFPTLVDRILKHGGKLENFV